ncbi:thiol-disulfide oxidoreductase DCC family protein [Edaphobacter albus]|uniref:thiol-disulfide oxidoreductase DCC family protein n=1 Tax=Edaphobacter sp. 4G125 TaxID=2763071 RepID=UPI0016487D95|nr:DCC1-like thiol-disulfide oxidoreductase family protein [Edaphobacter sp. 4G125]QNI36803.1 DUF393 domain-containing protein [Edaphobacter sp. 4G125]
MTEIERTRIAGRPVLLYDGVCALCNGIVQLVLRFDREGMFRFAPLQSVVAQELAGGRATGDGVVLITDTLTPKQKIYGRSDAVAETLLLLGWKVLGRTLKAIPHALREVGYGVVARVRYRLFGKYEICPVPQPEVRARFVTFD